MRVILNVVWLVLAGFWLAVSYAIAGLVICILIITIPFGLQAFKLAGYVQWPFAARRSEAIPPVRRRLSAT